MMNMQPSSTVLLNLDHTVPQPGHAQTSALDHTADQKSNLLAIRVLLDIGLRQRLLSLNSKLTLHAVLLLLHQ